MTGRSHLHDDAKYWVIGRGTLLHLHRRLSYDVTKTLRFVPTDNGSFLAPTFAPGTKKLEPQSVRTVRELWCRSAQLLIEVIDHTDTEERTRRSVVVTPKYLKDHNLGVRAGAARPTRSG